MWFKELVVKLGFPHNILSDLTSSSQIWFHLNGSQQIVKTDIVPNMAIGGNSVIQGRKGTFLG